MRQLLQPITAYEHMSTVITRCRLQAPADHRWHARDGEQHAFQVPAQLNVPLDGK